MNRDDNEGSRRSIGYSHSAAETYDAVRFIESGGQAIDSIEREVIDSLVGQSPPNGLALDVGSGTGRFSMVVAEKGYRTVSLDGSFPMLTVHREKMLEGNGRLKCCLVQGNALHLPFTDGCFDIVLSVRMLNQLGSDSQRIGAIKEMVRVCKPGGKVALDLTNVASFGYLSGEFSHLTAVPRIKKELRGAFPQIRIIVRGRFFIPFSVFLILDHRAMQWLARADSLTSRILGQFCTRVYLEIEK